MHILPVLAGLEVLVLGGGAADDGEERHVRVNLNEIQMPAWENVVYARFPKASKHRPRRVASMGEWDSRMIYR